MTDTRFKFALALADLPLGQMRACELAGRQVLVCHTKDGVYAVDEICSHAEAQMSEGRLRGTRIICPLHGASFDVRDGRVLGGPATRPLAVYEVRISHGSIEIATEPAAGKPGAD